MGTTTNAADVADAIDRAASIIDERGLCRMTLEDIDGRVCAVGGLAAAVYGVAADGYLTHPGIAWTHGRHARDVEFYNAVTGAVADALGREFDDDDSTFTIYRWNDGYYNEPHRDQAQVVGTFRRIAADLRATAAVA